MRVREAVVAAQRDAMRADPTVVLLGEDVAEAGGVFKTSEGLLAEFGADRVRDTPISEMGFLGAAVGAAMTGLRPIVEIMFVEFLGVALDQLATQAAKMHYLSGGALRVPLVVRATSGSGLGFAAQHSQSLETWMFSTPGLKLAVASGARSAYGLIRAAVDDDSPVVVLEPRALYADREEFDPASTSTRLGEAVVLRHGEGVTLVGLGTTVRTALAAAAANSHWRAEVIDLQSLVPWDRELVVESVRRTGRLVVVEEGPFTGGWGTEIAAFVGSAGFRDLAAPVLRITGPDVPVPYGKDLEVRYAPSVEYLTTQVESFLGSDELPDPWWQGMEAS